MRQHHATPGGALAALILFFALVVSAQAADSTSCLPDCPADTFSTDQVDVVFLPGGCAVRVTWASRLACGVWHDVIIKSVQPVNDSCAGIPLQQLLSQATKALLEFNPMRLPPYGVDSCVVNWRVVKGACWRFEYRCDDSIAVPCDLTECCLSAYQVCQHEGFRTVVPLGGGGGGAALCDTVAGCIPVCGGGAAGGSANGTDAELSSAGAGAPSNAHATLPRKVRIHR